MQEFRVALTDCGEIHVVGIRGLLLQCLYQLPEILRERDHDGVRQRLFPDPISGDDRSNAEWHETMDTDLHYLFASAEATVVRDMATLDRGEIVFPADHVDAWLSALNQARLILGELHAVTEEDMALENLRPGNKRDLALIRIHVYGALLHQLMGA